MFKSASISFIVFNLLILGYFFSVIESSSCNALENIIYFLIKNFIYLLIYIAEIHLNTHFLNYIKYFDY